MNPDTEDRAGMEPAESPRPGIDPDKVCFVIVKARELDAGDEGAEADASNPTDDKFSAVLAADEQEGIRQELVDFVEAMNVDEQADLVALAWTGRGDFAPEEWADAVAEAGERREGPTSAYLLGIPDLADLLEEGLAAFGESCLDLETGRL